MSVALTKQNTNVILACFHALSDSIRLQVIELLQNQELCVCDLCEQLNLKQSKLSFHLKILKEANLVFARQEGRWIYYRLNPEQFKLVEDYLKEYSHNTQSLLLRKCDDSCC
jgi:ArsR family transcriptional regulator